MAWVKMEKNKLTKVDILAREGRRLHLIDVNAVVKTKYWSMKHLSWVVDGKVVNTGGIYSIMSMFLTIPLNTDDKIIFCIDGGKNVRKEMYEGYKGSRESSKGSSFHIETNNQINEVENILRACGFEIFKEIGYEADDFIVGAHKAFKDLFDWVYVWTNDYDMAQLIDDKTILKNCRNKSSDITINNFEQVLGIPYNTSNLSKAILGCSSDDVKGVKGFGPKKFKELLDWVEGQGYDFAKIYELEQEEEIINRYDKFNDTQREEALRSLRVVRGMTPPNFHFEFMETFINTETLAWYLNRYGIKSVIKKLKESGAIKFG